MKLFVSLLLTLLITSAVFAQKKKPADKVRAVKTTQGTLTNFEMGDYLHANFKTPAGKKLSLFVMKPGMEYFLAAHKGKRFSLKYEIVDTYIPEADGMMKIERLASASAGAVTYESWWKSTRAKYPGEEAHKKYGSLVEKYTAN
jgi:hypothetical protein